MSTQKLFLLRNPLTFLRARHSARGAHNVTRDFDRHSFDPFPNPRIPGHANGDETRNVRFYTLLRGRLSGVIYGRLNHVQANDNSLVYRTGKNERIDLELAARVRSGLLKCEPGAEGGKRAPPLCSVHGTRNP